jgi:hypothetical protein
MFLIKKAERFFVYKNYNYTIDLNDNKPFYKLLYNLLIIELTQLLSYLNDALIKN